jgi:hypothetical protein
MDRHSGSHRIQRCGQNIYYDYATKGPFIATLNRETLEPRIQYSPANLAYNAQDLLVVGNKMFLNFGSIIKSAGCDNIR